MVAQEYALLDLWIWGRVLLLYKVLTLFKRVNVREFTHNRFPREIVMKKPRLSIKQSSIHGYGVFADEPIRKHQLISQLRGSRVKYQSDIQGQSNRYGDWIGLGGDVWIDPIDEFQYLNHSCNPSAGFKGVKKLKLHALRDISAGEEISIDYSTTEEDPHYGFENLEPQHEHYRQFVGPVQSLPVEVYRRYLPYIPGHFQKVYQNEVLSKDDGKVSK